MFRRRSLPVHRSRVPSSTIRLALPYVGAGLVTLLKVTGKCEIYCTGAELEDTHRLRQASQPDLDQ